MAVVKSSPRNISFNLDLRNYCLCYGNGENGMDKAEVFCLRNEIVGWGRKASRCIIEVGKS